MSLYIKNHPHSILFFILITTISLGVYFQGLNGPFIFDDGENIENNSSLRITKLDKNSISSAAFSGRAGPLKRPVAMLSFALNYYVSGNLHPFAFKLTNVLIQAVCGWLLFIFTLQLLRESNKLNKVSISHKTTLYSAFAIALLWAVHPINLTSVLYIVQRMTSLSTLFTLATLIFYIKARNHHLSSYLNKAFFFYLASLICFLIAIFSKENALLTPVYLLLIEWVFFSQHLPWVNFKKIPASTRKLLWCVLLITATALLLFILNYAANGYTGRTFTLVERVLTEGRVICFYLSLIVLPRINAFGIFHDDIPISTSLFDPWSTLISLIIIASLIFLAIRSRKTMPLFSFGVLFFFAGHLLESTIFSLEIAHEHRNHLASMGIIIALFGLFTHNKPFSVKAFALTSSLFFVIFSATTMLRANHWQSEYDIAAFSVAHHPNSAATQGLMSNAAYARKEYTLAEDSINKARLLEPNESAYAINSLVLSSLLGKPINNGLELDIRDKLRKYPFTPSTQIALAHISTNLTKKGFIPLQPYFANWLEIILNKIGPTRQASIYHYFLAKAYLATGNTLGAINEHQQAFNLDKKFINPLFEMGNIFLSLRQAEGAKIVLEQIIQANKNPDLARHYDTHIEELRAAIEKIERKKVAN